MWHMLTGEVFRWDVALILLGKGENTPPAWTPFQRNLFKHMRLAVLMVIWRDHSC